MCRPLNEHQSLHDELRGLVYYVIAILSFYFLVHTYKIPQNPKKSVKKPTDTNDEDALNLGSPSDTNVSFRRSHEFRQAQRAKYLSTKKKQNSKELSSRPSLSRQFMVESDNNSPCNSPTLGRKHNPVKSSSISSVAELGTVTEVERRQINQTKTNSSRKATSLRRKAFLINKLSQKANSIE